jgi:hypothetical protein
MVREVDELTETVRAAADAQVKGSRELLERLAVFRGASASGVEQSEVLGRVVAQLAERARALERELAALRAGDEAGAPA